jgi:hypothetical protein
MHKIFIEIRTSIDESGNFAMNFLKNLDPKFSGNKYLTRLELLL